MYTLCRSAAAANNACSIQCMNVRIDKTLNLIEYIMKLTYTLLCVFSSVASHKQLEDAMNVVQLLEEGDTNLKVATNLSQS